MQLRINAPSIIISIIIGAAIGFLGGSALVLILWAAIGIAIGAFSTSTKAAIVNGAAYGFVLSYVFMISGYSGKESLSTKLVPFLILGVFGAICGLVLGYLGNKLLSRH